MSYVILRVFNLQRCCKVRSRSNLKNPVPAKPILGVRSTKHGNSEQVPSLVSCSPFKQTNNILLWLKGTEILEDGPVNPWTLPQQIIKTQFRNSVVCLFGVLLYILYHCSFNVQWQTTKTMKLLKKQSLSNSSKREDMENKWQNPEKN